MTSGRNFIGNAGKLLAVATLLPGTTFAAEKTMAQKSSKSLFRFGMAGYTFANFTIDKTLEMMKITDGHYLCNKDFHLPYKSSDEEISLFLKRMSSNTISGTRFIITDRMKKVYKCPFSLQSCRRFGPPNRPLF